MDESLVALAIAMDIELSDVLVMPSKDSSGGTFFYERKDQTCSKKLPL